MTLDTTGADRTIPNDVDRDAVERIGSILLGLGLIVLFAYLHTMASEFRSVASAFPTLVLKAGITFSALLVVKKAFLTEPLFGAQQEQSGMAKYLTGGESQYTLPQRARRLGVLAAWIVALFGLLAVNIYLAITVFYVGVAVSLGVRDPKFLAAGTGIVLVFVFLVFDQVLDIPLEVF